MKHGKKVITKEVLEYRNIFDAITTSTENANQLKQESDLSIAIRDIISSNEISNTSELTDALQRVEQLWDVQPNSVDATEFEQLVELICDYEDKLLFDERKGQTEIKVDINNL